LRFPVNLRTGVGMVAPRGLATGQGFVTEMTPAIYDRAEQQKALTSLLDLLIGTLEDSALISGPDSRPWAAESARFIAFTVADFALSFIVPLKRSQFRDEREWRIIVRPCHTPFSSDPTEADRNCECFIKVGPSKRYVELAPLEPEEQLIPGVPFGLPTKPPRFPINAVRVGPCEQGEKMAELARRLLDKHGLHSTHVLRSKLPTSFDCN